MMWVMMWATGTMVAMALAKGMVGMKAGRGGGQAKVAMAAAAAAAVVAVVATAAAAAAYYRGCLFFIVNIFLCGIFICGRNWRGHISPHTLVTLEICRHTFW
jgi:hypothetical protein